MQHQFVLCLRDGMDSLACADVLKASNALSPEASRVTKTPERSTAATSIIPFPRAAVATSEMLQHRPLSLLVPSLRSVSLATASVCLE